MGAYEKNDESNSPSKDNRNSIEYDSKKSRKSLNEKPEKRYLQGKIKFFNLNL